MGDLFGRRESYREVGEDGPKVTFCAVISSDVVIGCPTFKNLTALLVCRKFAGQTDVGDGFFSGRPAGPSRHVRPPTPALESLTRDGFANP